MKQEIKKYEVHLIEENQLKITGRGEDPLWEKAVLLTDFNCSSNYQKPSRKQFKAVWDGHTLFFCFTIFDTMIHIEKKDDSIESIGSSDRVELFFRPDNSLNPYYCLEIDTAARVMDYMAYPNKKFDFDWNWPQSNLLAKSSINDTSFVVEGQISISSLKMLNLIKDNLIEVGIFTSEYYEVEKSIFDPVLCSWVHQENEIPNFHTASSFGILNLLH